MSVLDWIISILLFIVSLGVLIIVHELGHFSMAKLFKVYCHEFSIGFGPAIIHKRPKGKETYISLRAIPFGGYVAMYGEEGEGAFEEGQVIPPERSIEGIKKWKKAIIISAGIILNAILALTLFAISDICLPKVSATLTTHVEENSIAYNLGLRDDESLFPISYNGEDGKMYYEVTYQFSQNDVLYQGRLLMLDNDITIGEQHYCYAYYPTGSKNETSLIQGGMLYPAVTKEQVANDQDMANAYKNWLNEGKLNYYPNFKKDTYKPVDPNFEFTAKVQFISENKSVKTVNIPVKLKQVEGKKDVYEYQDIGLLFKTITYWDPFGERVAQTFKDFGNATIVVFQGIGMIFTGGLKNMSGIVGIFQLSAQVYSTLGISTYIYMWGLISVNLAVFNLLPFPGLDGFTLLVTAIEGISHKKVPNKFKRIMSVIGLVLLFALMAVVLVMDIMRWAGVL